MMTTIRRQAASSLYGLAPLLENMLNGKLDLVESLELSDESEFEPDYAFIETISSDIRAMIDRVKTLDSRDPKAEAAKKLISEKQELSNNKVLLFSCFRHTLSYLVGKIESEGVRLGLIHGNVPDDVRAELRKRFALPKDNTEAIDVLLSSEVGCEGLDFQFCDCIVNYDLPWNPMRIEQRIGRIDRYGQKSPTVAIFNLITPGTIDADIYDRCLMRIGVFRHSIGGNEEILGEITQELHNIAESFDLSEEQKAARLRQLADNKIRQVEEEQRLEQKQAELFGLDIHPSSWDEKLRQARSWWLEPSALSSCVTAYLTRRLGKEQEYLMGDKDLKTLRLSQEARNALLEDFRRLPRSQEPTSRVWEKWLKGSLPTIQVTFDRACASENLGAVLLVVGHPLLKQAAAFLQVPEAVYSSLTVTDPEIPPGTYPFAVYRWRRHGVKQDEELVAVSNSPKIDQSLFDLISGADVTQ